jgi:hypothetical protein
VHANGGAIVRYAGTRLRGRAHRVAQQTPTFGGKSTRMDFDAKTQ